MVIKIKDKEYEVRFGIRFIRELDKANVISTNHVKFGAGLELKAPLLFDHDVVALSDIIYTGTVTEKPRPTPGQIDDYVENHEDIEKLFEEVIEELKKSNASKLKMVQLEKSIAAEMEE